MKVLWPDCSDDVNLTIHQKEVLKKATSSSFSILNGSPGTGKTFTAAILIGRIVKKYGEDEIAIAAPTGKAAVRCSQAMTRYGLSKVKATTIHRLLGITRNGRDSKGWGFYFNNDRMLPYKFIIVDESSMIDSSLMSSFLEACDCGTHMLLIGDTAQLPPVGHGAPLRDLIEAGIPTGELKETLRNAGMIVQACQRIKAGENFETCDRVDLDAEPPANLRMIEARTENNAIASLEALLQGMKKFHPIWQTQVICPMNKRSRVSREQLNDRLQRLLNPMGYSVKGNPFKVGDKIICLKNGWNGVVMENYFEESEAVDAANYIRLLVPHTDQEADRVTGLPSGAVGEPGKPAEIYIANGEIGRVVAVGEKLTVARFSEGDALIKIPMGKAKPTEEENGDGSGTGGSPDTGTDEKGKASNFDLAYAITVHKAQGSESPCIVVMIDEAAGMVAGKEWTYTAISRAAKLCVLIGRKDVLLRQSKKVTLAKRKTFLAELLKQGGEL